jgi:hypothetical protein
VEEEVKLRPAVVSPPNSTGDPDTPIPPIEADTDRAVACQVETGSSADGCVDGDEKVKAKSKRVAQTRAAREASLAEKTALDATFIEGFDPHTGWLPPNTSPTDYTPDFCQKLERQYWRNCGLGKPPWYGADTQGTLIV